jgi:hypothetical protein
MHEGQRLYNLKVETLINQVLLSAIRIKHLLGVGTNQGIKVSVEIFLIAESLFGTVLGLRAQDTA